MPFGNLEELLLSPAEVRPALLEGRWLGHDADQSIMAAQPVSALEDAASAIEALPKWIAQHSEQFPAGAAIGFLSYELARAFERLPLSPQGGLPDYSFAYYPRIEQRASRDLALLSPPGSTSAEIESGFDEARFISDVEKIQHYIGAGDIYQANLTQQFAARLNEISPAAIYARLSQGRAPMRAFLKSRNLTILSNSPERFFRVRGDRIVTSPIKGTLARSHDPREDPQLAAQLLASPKDRAENVMIVDLLRNDLGRICDYETIHARLWEVDALPHLFHLVSHVEGRLRPSVGLLDILRALFPCGSITGAPKIRAMEILSEIERAPRGVSMGAIGVIRGAPGTRDFEADFNVAIRTMTICGDIASFNVGCGIVCDSEPRAEYQEMLLKARPLLAALGVERAAAQPTEARPVGAK